MATKSRIKNVPGTGGMPAAFGGAGGHHHHYHHCGHHRHLHLATNVMTRNSSNATSAQELWLWHHCCLHQSPEVMKSDDRGDLDVNDGHATMMLYCYIAILLYCYIHGFQPAAWAECYLPSQMGAGKPDNLPQVADDGDGDVANDDDGDHQLK